jgi:hypothetical protein
MRDGDLSLGDSGLGEEFGSVNYTASLGRISGKLLSPDLLRNGVDLTFRNYTSDPDILYLDVTNKRIGINIDTPQYELDVNSVIKTTKLEATNQLRVGNVIANSPSGFSTVVGALQILPADTHIPIPFHRITTANLEFRSNMIGSLSNSNIVLDPNGSGTVELQATTNATGDVAVTGNITIGGNLAAGLGKGKTVNLVTASTTPGSFNGATARGIRVIGDQTDTVGWTISNTGNPWSNGTAIGSLTIVYTSSLLPEVPGSPPAPASTIVYVLEDIGVSVVGTTGYILKSPGATSGSSVITVGDSPYDTVSVAPDFTQSIIPGVDNSFDFGSSSKRWASAYIPDWKQANNLAPYRINVNDRTLIDGVDNKISGVQGNDDINISPDSGITQIEQLRFSNGTITNLVNSGLTGTPGILSVYIAGTGYTNGLAISEAGTRFNIVTGAGGSITSITAIDTIVAYVGQGAFTLIQGINTTAKFTVSGYISTNPMTFAGTGTGYLQFTGDGAISLPAGPTTQRPPNPEVGDTRWNTDLQYMECFDGSTYIIATGPGETINRAKMEELGNLWTLILA